MTTATGAAGAADDWRAALLCPVRGRTLWVAGSVQPPAWLATTSEVVVRPPDDLPTQAFDLVVLRASGRDARLRRRRAGGHRHGAIRLVAPGGRLWLECDGHLAVPPRLGAELASAGFVDIARLAVFPGSVTPEHVVPLDDGRAGAWYVEHAFWATTPLRRVWRLVARIAARAGSLHLVAPATIITARRPERAVDRVPRAERGGFRPSIIGELPDHAAGVGPVGTWALQRSSRRATAPTILRLWDEGPHPTHVVKIGRGPAAARVIDEQHRLERLASYRADTRIRVPMGLGSHRLGPDTCGIESSVPGRPFNAWLEEHGRSVVWPAYDPWVGWLAAAQRRTATTDEGVVLVQGLLGDAVRLDLPTGARRTLLDASVESDRLARREPLPSVLAHHDLGPANQLVDEAGRIVGVVDWESSGPGAPALDLIYWVALLCDSVGIDARRAGWTFENLLPVLAGRQGGGGDATRVVRGWLRRYLDVVGIDPAWLPILSLATWAMHARNEAAKGEGGPFRRRLLAAVEAQDAASVRPGAGTAG